MAEPRFTLRKWFDNGAETKVIAANLKKRDDTNASYEAQFEMTETELKQIFETEDVDVVFIIKKVRVDPITVGRLTIGYRHFIGIEPAVVNKFASGVLNVEGSEMLGKALGEVRRIIRAEIDTGGTIMFQQEQPAINRIGSTLLFGDNCIVRFDQFI